MHSKVDLDVQRSFLNDTLMSLIEKAMSGLIELFFVDVSHFVMCCFPGKVWSIVQKWVKTACGQQCYNVLSTLNFLPKRSKQF